MVCVRCGENEVFKEALCRKCYFHIHKENDKKLTLTICPKCGSYKQKTWKETKVNAVKEAIKSIFGAKQIEKITNHDYEVDESYKVHINTDKETCKRCQKLSSGYFEAILQLRGITKNQKKEIFEYLESVDITKTEKVTNGYDLYFISKKDAEHAVFQLKKRFHGVIKRSATLFSLNRQTSKKIYRHTFLFKAFTYQIDDYINYKGIKMQVKGFDKKVILKDESSKKYSVTYAELERAGVF